MDDAFQHPGFWLNEDHFELCGVFTVVGVIGVAGVFGRLVVEKYFGVFPKFLVGVFDEPSCRSSDFALGMNVGFVSTSVFISLKRSASRLVLGQPVITVTSLTYRQGISLKNQLM